MHNPNRIEFGHQAAWSVEETCLFLLYAAKVGLKKGLRSFRFAFIHSFRLRIQMKIS